MKLLLLIIFLAYHCDADQDCYHPIGDIKMTNVPQADSNHSRVKRAPPNIRITPYYHSSYTSMPNSAYITQNIITPAIEYWQNTLLVNSPISKPLIFDRGCTGASFDATTVGGAVVSVCKTACATQQLCFNTQIPDQYLQACYVGTSLTSYTIPITAGAGAANTDLLLIVTQSSSSCTGSVLSYSSICQIELGLNRPVLGLINICPGMLNVGVGQKMSIANIKHEIGHILGMSANLFAFWRTQSGAPRTPRDSTGMPNLGKKPIGNSSIYQYSDTTVNEYSKTFNYPTGPSTRTVSYIVTPTVQQEMRNYFLCPTVEGLMLEGYDVSFSSLSHFEKLYLQNELMTGSLSVNSLASRLTLAVLQDTGWYISNLENAENFNYAKGKGCNFLTSSCYDYINTMQSSSKLLEPYCNQPMTVGGLSCTRDFMSQQVCSLTDDFNLARLVPAQYKYFANPNWAVPDPLSDFCPTLMVYSFSISGNLVYTGECKDSSNNAVQGTANDYFAQTFGSSSRCVEFSKPPNWYYKLTSQPVIPQIQGAGCYQYQCLTNGLVILVSNIPYQCTAANLTINSTSTNAFLSSAGSLVCPACEDVCTPSKFRTTCSSSYFSKGYSAITFILLMMTVFILRM